LSAITRKECRAAKVWFQMSLSWTLPTTKPPPWMVRRVGYLVVLASLEDGL
jgi:hypothetical protein